MWELDGPMPMLNRSNTLTAMEDCLLRPAPEREDRGGRAGRSGGGRALPAHTRQGIGVACLSLLRRRGTQGADTP
ncbi:hypothetical protein GCM10022204_33490 [Microlunatus aurantiacus]|uniref:Uncharacterized protein n=1 Tax=Microlunatus aurantiacus TaxID=446786 RepID=A0ABP7E3Z0_9ACTN